MSKFIFLSYFTVLSILFFGVFSITAFAYEIDTDNDFSAPEFVSGELIISFKPNANSQEIENFYENHSQMGLKQIKNLDKKIQNQFDIQERLVKVPNGQERKLIEILKNNPAIANVSLNYILHTTDIPDDTNFSNLWGLHNTGQTGGTLDSDIDAPEAWVTTRGSHGIIVGVIDTGIDYTHEDLAANVWVNPSEIPNNGIDDDGNGYIDDIHGINAIDGTGDPMDDHGHGTHVSGTIGAVGNNTLGVAGVNWNVTIIGCKFLNSVGSGNTADALECIEYFNDLKYSHGIDISITSNSWGGGGPSESLKTAFESPGQADKILHIIAAGNGGSDGIGDNNDVISNYPANYEIENKIVVAATDHNDNYASFSNYGPNSVDLAAPGVSIFSTVPSSGNSCCSSPSMYKSLSGTSMATPHVSGAAALLLSYKPSLDYETVKNVILCNTDLLSSSGKTITDGRLNIGNAINNDLIIPSQITNLSTSFLGVTSITISFDASGDDGDSGNACYYDVRYSKSPIDESNWNSAIRVIGEPKPQSSGSSETILIPKLDPSTVYYIGVKVGDEIGNISSLSNVIQATTSSGQVIFDDDMEGSVSLWQPEINTLWHTTEHRSNSPTTSHYYGIEGDWDYNTNQANSGLLRTVDYLDLTSANDAVLYFSEWSQVEPSISYDRTRVAVSFEGSLWFTVFESHGTNGQWIDRTVNLKDFVGSNILLGFHFDTIDRFENNFEGWYIDDVKVSIATNTVDSDSDGIPDSLDNCPNDSNADQLDTDLDGIGDVCDAFPNDPDNDIDGDGVSGDIDNCPNDSNADQLDTDLDGIGDVCDPETLINKNTILTTSTILKGDLIVESGALLTINPGVTLDVDFINQKILIKYGGGILIKYGGRIT